MSSLGRPPQMSLWVGYDKDPQIPVGLVRSVDWNISRTTRDYYGQASSRASGVRGTMIRCDYDPSDQGQRLLQEAFKGRALFYLKVSPDGTNATIEPSRVLRVEVSGGFDGLAELGVELQGVVGDFELAGGAVDPATRIVLSDNVLALGDNIPAGINLAALEFESNWLTDSREGTSVRGGLPKTSRGKPEPTHPQLPPGGPGARRIAKDDDV